MTPDPLLSADREREDWEAGSMTSFIDRTERMTADGPVRVEAVTAFGAFDQWMASAPTRPLDAADMEFIDAMRTLRASARSTPDALRAALERLIVGALPALGVNNADILAARAALGEKP